MTEEELKGHEKAAVAVFLATESGPAQDISDRLTALIREVRKLHAERDVASKERDELQALIDRQHTRVVTATHRWREESKQFLTMPDLGTLVQWLLDKGDTTAKENADLKHRLAELQKLALETMQEHPAGSEHSKAYSALFAAGYNMERTPSALYEENLKLKAAVAEHMDQLDDDRCWLDDEKLYSKAGLDLEEWASALPPKEEFLANCTRYHASRQKPGHPYVTVAERIKQAVQAEQDRIVKVYERLKSLGRRSEFDVADIQGRGL